MSEDRFLARARRVTRRRVVRMALGVLAVAVVAASVWAIWFSSLLTVRTVTVEGETTVSAAHILRDAGVPRGRPLVRVDIASIESRVASIERIASVDVSRSWPRTVRITVVERTSVVWASIGGVIRGIDRDGIDFRTYDKAPKELLEAKIPSTGSADRLQVTQAVASVVTFITTHDPSLRSRIQSIGAATKDSIELDLDRGKVVAWGSADKGRRKLAVLDSLLKIDAKRYDVSAPDQPTTRD